MTKIKTITKYPATPYFELYPDKAGEFRWRLVAANGEIVGDSGEGYTTKASAKASIKRFIKTVAEAAELSVVPPKGHKSVWAPAKGSVKSRVAEVKRAKGFLGYKACGCAMAVSECVCRDGKGKI